MRCGFASTARSLIRGEHKQTRTYGPRGAVTARVEAAANLSFRDTLARDFRDIRKLFGPKYDEGLRKLIEYYKQNFPGLMAK